MTDIPAVLLPYQQRFVADVMANPVVVVEKSRRTGFSWVAGAIAALVSGAARTAGGMDTFYMGYNLEMAREFIGYVAEWARQFAVAATEMQEFVFPDPERPEQDIKAFRIRFASGFDVVALPSVPRALRGMQGLVIIDEAAFHKDLAELLKAAFALLIWGGKVVVISTHNGADNPFNGLVQDIRSGREEFSAYTLERVTFDDAIADGLYERVCMKAGDVPTPEGKALWRARIIAVQGAGADEELFVIPSPTGGAYLPGTLIEARMSDAPVVLRHECPSGFAMLPDDVRVADTAAWCEAHLAPVLDTLDGATPHAFGEDFGRVRDLTVVWLVAIGRDLVRRTPLVLELRNVPFEQQRQILFFLLARVPRLRAGAMDAGGNGMYLAEVTAQRFGERIQQVKLSEPWYREHMPKLRAAIEDGTLELPRDREIGDDLRSLRLVRGVGRVPDRTRDDDRASRHGDAAIAAVLAWVASCADPEEYGYEAVRRPFDPAPGAASLWPIDDELRLEELGVRGEGLHLRGALV